jgi:hypothetical protein
MIAAATAETNMLKLLALAGLLAFAGFSAMAPAHADVFVNGYTRSNGTYVAPHYRTAPDGNPYNNYSYGR